MKTRKGALPVWEGARVRRRAEVFLPLRAVSVFTSYDSESVFLCPFPGLFGTGKPTGKRPPGNQHKPGFRITRQGNVFPFNKVFHNYLAFSALRVETMANPKLNLTTRRRVAMQGSIFS